MDMRICPIVDNKYDIYYNLSIMPIMSELSGRQDNRGINPVEVGRVPGEVDAFPAETAPKKPCKAELKIGPATIEGEGVRVAGNLSCISCGLNRYVDGFSVAVCYAEEDLERDARKTVERICPGDGNLTRITRI